MQRSLLLLTCILADIWPRCNSSLHLDLRLSADCSGSTDSCRCLSAHVCCTHSQQLYGSACPASGFLQVRQGAPTTPTTSAVQYSTLGSLGWSVTIPRPASTDAEGTWSAAADFYSVMVSSACHSLLCHGPAGLKSGAAAAHLKGSADPASDVKSRSAVATAHFIASINSFAPPRLVFCCSTSFTLH